jgi:hypothetical protein
VAQIEDTLRELDRWYNELPGGTDRHKLLAKLATLELCGWLEHRLDSLVYSAGRAVGLDEDWIEASVVKSNFGFTYQDHLRKMLSKIIGEYAVLHLEETFENVNPGALDQLRNILSALWKSRGVLAHTHTAAPVVHQQPVINAPSWTINQQRVIAKMLDQLENNFAIAFSRTIAKR